VDDDEISDGRQYNGADRSETRAAAGRQALVGAMPQVETVCRTDDLSSTLAADVDGCPDLVLLTCGMEGEGGAVGSMIKQVKARWPRARCITLVGSVEQQQEAELADVDAVVLNGLPAQKLLKIIAGTLVDVHD
jgi:DNA-binding NarL/FixJ family response regulator